MDGANLRYFYPNLGKPRYPKLNDRKPVQNTITYILLKTKKHSKYFIYLVCRLLDTNTRAGAQGECVRIAWNVGLFIVIMRGQ